MRHAQGALDDPPRVRRPRARRRRPCRSSACTATRRPAPRSARPTRSSAPTTASCRSARKPRCIACNNCVLACPFGVPKMNDRARADDEVRHVLRPHVGRQEADVRDGLPEPGAVLRHARARSSSCGRARRRSTGSSSAARRSRRKVYMMVPRGDRARRRDWTSPRRWTRPPARDRADAGRRRRSVRRCAGVAVADESHADRSRIDTRTRGPDRHRAGERLRPRGRRADHDRARRPADGRAAGLAAGLPDRLAAGPLRRAPRLHEVPGADQPGVRRRAVLDRRAELAGGGGAASPRCARVASLDELPVGGVADVRLSRRHDDLRAGAHRRRTRSSPTARSARTCPAPCVPRVDEGDPALPVPRGLLRPATGPPDRRPAAPAAAARHARGRGGEVSTPPASRRRTT